MPLVTIALALALALLYGCHAEPEDPPATHPPATHPLSSKASPLVAPSPSSAPMPLPSKDRIDDALTDLANKIDRAKATVERRDYVVGHRDDKAPR